MLTWLYARADYGRVALALFAREYERTCNECGYTWRVPRSIGRRGIRGISAMYALGTSQAPGRTMSHALTDAVGARAEVMESYRLCAKCGVDDFSQRPVRRKS